MLLDMKSQNGDRIYLEKYKCTSCSEIYIVHSAWNYHSRKHEQFKLNNCRCKTSVYSLVNDKLLPFNKLEKSYWLIYYKAVEINKVD